MDPITISLILAGLSAGGGILSNLTQNPYKAIGSPDDVKNVNPYTQDYMDQLQGNMDNWNNQMSSYLGQAGDYGQDQQSLISQIMNFKPGAQYDPDAGMRNFLSQAGSLQGVAKNAAGGLGVDSYLKDLQNQATASINSQLSPEMRGSGAYASALSEGMASPLFQVAQQEQQNRMNVLSPLLNQGMQQSYANELNRYNAAQQADQMALSQMGQGLQGYGNLQQAAMQNAGLMGQMFSQGQGIMGQMAAPEWWQPNHMPNPNFISLSDLMGMGMQGASMFGNIGS